MAIDFQSKRRLKNFQVRKVRESLPEYFTSEFPDLVTFLGYEWTQVGNTANEHYGHKNVMFLDIEEDRVLPHD